MQGGKGYYGQYVTNDSSAYLNKKVTYTNIAA